MAANDFESVLRIDRSEERMQITRLPFYDIFGAAVLKLNELPITRSASVCTYSALSFKLHPKHAELMEKGYQLQLRMFQIDPEKEQADDFPPKCDAKIDDKEVELPEVIPTSLLDLLFNGKRKSQPVDITKYIQKENESHKLELLWLNDGQKWAVGIWLVLPVNALELMSRLSRTGPRQSSEETKKKIGEMLNDDENGIALDQLKISLKCPIMKTRMKIPARSKKCSHLQCFDLQNFLQLNEKTATWKCPICNGNASYDNLIIVQYFMDLLQTVENLDVEEIELLQNGNWKIIGETGSNTNITSKNIEVINLEEEEIVTLDDSDVRIAQTARNSTTSRTNKNAPRTSRNAKSSEIITLDSSDDELVASEDEDIVITSANVTRRPNVPTPTEFAAAIVTISAMFNRLFSNSR